MIDLINLILFAVSAYYITKSEACPCPDADASKRKYILYFCYFEIIYLTLSVVLGKSLNLLLLLFPVLFIIPLFAVIVIGGLVWCIFTIQYVNSMKKCKCPDSIVQETTYANAILRLIAIVILMLGTAFIGFRYISMSGNERKLFKNSLKKGYIKELTKAYLQSSE